MLKTQGTVQQRLVFGLGIFFLIGSIFSFTWVVLKMTHTPFLGFIKEFHLILTHVGFLCLSIGGLCVFAALILQRDPTKRIVHAAILNSMLLFGAIGFSCVVMEGFLYVKYHDVQIGGVTSPSRYTFYKKYYRLNEAGFRDVNHSLRKPEGTTRIVVVGDSFTFGAGVKQVDDLYFKILEQKLQQEYPAQTFKSVSIAKKGWSTAQEFKAFKTLGMNYNPDLVILGYVLNDPESPEIKARKSSEFHDDHLLPYPYGKFLYATSFAYFIIEKKLKSLPFLRDETIQQSDYIREIFSGDNLKQHKTILRDFLAYIQAQDMEVIVVLFPSLRYVHSPSYPYSEMHQIVAQTVRESGARFLDLLDPLKNSGITNLTVSEFDGHPNEDVHRIAAAALFDLIYKERKFASLDKI